MVQNTDDRSKDRLTGSSSDDRAKESKFSEEFDIHKKVNKGKMDSEGADTLANESMSMVDCLTMTRARVDPNERMSEVEFAGALNERLRSSIRRQRDNNPGQRQYVSEESQRSLSKVQSVGDSVTEGPTTTGNANDEPTETRLRGREECATGMWNRALKTAREDPSLTTTDQSFGSSFDQNRQGQSHVRRLSDSYLVHEHTIEGQLSVPRRQSRSLSRDAAALARHHRGSFNLDRHQPLCMQIKQPLTRSTGPTRSSKTKRSLLDFREFTTLGRQNHNKLTKPSPAAVTPGKDYLAWARFPSSTRLERNGAAADKDGVSTRDFSPPIEIDRQTPTTSRNRSKLSLMTQPDNMGVHTPGSWRFLKFGHGRKKSRSMSFAILKSTTDAEREKEKEKEKDHERKKKSAAFTLTRSLARWGRLYRSHSSDLRRFRAGHRSSISTGGKVEFPELEIVPGYDGAGRIGGRVRMEQLGDFEAERRKWMNDQKWREGSRGLFAGGMDGGPAPSSESQTSSLHGMMEEEEEQHRGGAATAAEKGENAWADIYGACVSKHDHKDNDTDEDDSKLRPQLHSNTHLLHSDPSTRTPTTSNTHRPASRTAAVEESYISCSVSGGMSDDFRPLTNYRGADGGLDDDTDDDVGDGEADGMKERLRMELQRLTSPELRDSTQDFRTQLQEEERRVREALLKGDGLMGLVSEEGNGMHY